MCIRNGDMKKDGSAFLPNSLNHVYCGMMRYIGVNGIPGIDVFKDKGFSQFQIDLDSEMKCLQAVDGISRIMKLLIMVRLLKRRRTHP